eukprot:CAMPEP_0206494772 /NCGR_PEP_ID=MMETSP0324_2-20121206/47982_1 /ASSEMBLY_ACC=CAM_ASM_000836 /TAXON_ID=2866 /ORGANISM="Crypthecodinium cohnii, Strain Seligo" /LENGTH=37 /DNA_ID= /DNA_START= /DNA_END= /DNA_ORIENTATION=
MSASVSWWPVVGSAAGRAPEAFADAGAEAEAAEAAAE